MFNRIVTTLVALVFVVGALMAASELVLQDGQVVRGAEVRRDGDNYVVVLESGDTVVLPAALVKEVRLEEQAPPEPEPQQLAGTPVTPPKTSDQLKVFGEPAKFQGNPADHEWRPKSDWNNDPTENNNWAPSEWAQSSIDPEWKPESAFDPGADVLEEGRATFQQGSIDNSWTPTDGFAK